MKEVSQYHFLLVFLIIITQALNYCSCYEVHDMDDAMQYLSRFGYIGKDAASSMNLIDASDVIKGFQKMAGIDQTGELNNETMYMMNVPRCGNKDMDHEMISDEDVDPVTNTIVRKRRKRYNLNEYRAKWSKRELTYRVAEYSPKTIIAPELVERDVKQAFKLWEDATNLNFIPSSNREVDIELHFTRMRHHDDFPFDGPGKTLAHAFPPGPGLGGDVHFDDSETWSVNTPKGTNVLFVAVHEIGHALGLSHSDTKGAIMQAFYGGYRPHLKLHSDDIAGIQSIYGRKATTTQSASAPRFSASTAGRGRLFPTTSRLIPLIGQWNRIIPTPAPRRQHLILNDDNVNTNSSAIVTAVTTTTPTTTTPFTTTTIPTNHPATPGFTRPDLCLDSKIDAITKLNDGFIYLFKGFYVFRIDEATGAVLPGWPSRIEFKFNGLEGNIDCALTRPNGKTYFFKSGKYWRFNGFKLDGDYPKSISKHFPGIPDHIDSAFENPDNGQIYFTKGDKLWRFDPKASSGSHVNEDVYPLSITTWNLPETGIDDALVSSTGSIYFFKDDKYWKFDSKTFKIAEADPPYPRSIKEKLGCGKTLGSGLRNLRQQKHFYYYSPQYI